MANLEGTVQRVWRPAEEPSRGTAGRPRARTLVVLAAVWLAGGLYAATFADRGWVPHDEGMLGHNAQRVLAGEMPHRDFDESYTGGLTFLHALAFRAFGENLYSLRRVVFLFFLGFVPAVYAIARRFFGPGLAGAITLCAVAWSLPNYFASMPSWYVLFFSTFGAVALLRGVDTGRRGWLFLSGICGGLGLLVIVVGLYFVGAALLFLAFREQRIAEDRWPRCPGPSAIFFFQLVACLAFVGMVVFLVRSHWEPMEFIHFVVPTLSVTGLLLWRSWQSGGGRFWPRMGDLLGECAPFLAGVLVPVAGLLLFYVSRGALPDLWRGLFVLPLRQVDVARRSLPPLGTIRAAIPYTLLLLASPWIAGRSRRTLGILLTVVLAALLLFSAQEPVYREIWLSARSLAVVATVLGCALLLRTGETRQLSAVREQEIFLLLSLTAVVSLVQFPFAAPIYFCYVAPLVLLALGAIVSTEPSRALHAPVLAFYLVFALLRMNPAYIFNLGVRYSRYGPLAVLDPQLASLRVPTGDREEYRRVVAAIRKRSAGPFLFAAPDCPEVYFLSSRLNPTRLVFDFLRPPLPAGELRRILDEKRVKVVVVNRDPHFSRRYTRVLAAALDLPFPHSEEIGRFQVRWRD